MPRTEIALPYAVDYLSILNEDNELDKDRVPALEDALLQKAFRAMCLSRQLDQRMLSLQRQGKLGTFAPSIGQEAAQVGSAMALSEQDWMVPSFREGAAQLWRGIPARGILLYTAGYNEGAAIPEGQRNLPNTVPVGMQIPMATGLAYACQQRDEDAIAMVYFGDGATSQGDFHEALNFAGVFRLPVVFVCQNNQWAISIPRDEQTRSKTLAQKGLAYGIPGLQVVGNDLLAVYAGAQEAVAQAREGEGPTLLECVTYRLSMHTTADDTSKYRDEEEVKAWEKRDPIPRLRRFLLGREICSEDDLQQLEDDIEAEIEQAWEQTQEQTQKLDDPLTMFAHIYEQMPPYLQWQREALKASLAKDTDADERS